MAPKDSGVFTALSQSFGDWGSLVRLSIIGRVPRRCLTLQWLNGWIRERERERERDWITYMLAFVSPAPEKGQVNFRSKLVFNAMPFSFLREYKVRNDTRNVICFSECNFACNMYCWRKSENPTPLLSISLQTRTRDVQF